MADKASRSVGSGDQPVPMKLFATWEVEKSSPNCIPRLCTMRLTRLHVLKPLDNELTSLVVAVKMQNSKRLLRSNEIMVPPAGIFDTGLDLSFSLQYPHFLKRDGNKLLVMLQRRKKYKNRTILGFKTLAIGHVNMSQGSIEDTLLCAHSSQIIQIRPGNVNTRPSSGQTSATRQEIRVGIPRRSRRVVFRVSGRSPTFRCLVSQPHLAGDKPSLPSPPPHPVWRYNSQHDNEDQEFVGSLQVPGGIQVKEGVTCVPSAVYRAGTLVPLEAVMPVLEPDGRSLEVRESWEKQHKDVSVIKPVLQRTVDNMLSLYSDAKEQINPVAQLAVLGLSSQPVDHEDNGHRKQASSDVDRSPDVDNDSDEDEVHDYNEFSSNDEMSDSEPMMIDEHPRHPRKSARSKTRPATTRQRNLKQKFRALMRKLKLTEDVLELDSEADHDLNDPDNAPPDIDEMLDELEDLSDSGPEIDTISVMSTPKPRLRPFFTGRSTTPEMEIPYRSDPTTPTYRSSTDSEATVKRSESDGQTIPTCEADAEVSVIHTQSTLAPAPTSGAGASAGSSPVTARPRSPMSKPKRVAQPRSTSYREKKSKKEYKDLRRHRSFSGAEDVMLAQKLQDRFQLIRTCSEADVKAAIVFLVGKIQKFCNSNARSPLPIKVGIMGGDAYINSVLRPYVEHFSAKTPDWQSFIKFLIIPFGTSAIGKYLGSMDTTYSSLFMDTQWREMFDKQDSQKLDSAEIANRVSLYLSGANSVQQIPVAEALIMCKTKGSDESSSQIFIPFISEVRIGTLETLNTSTSVEIDDSGLISPGLSSSPPASTPVSEKSREPHTPPSSPNIGAASASPGSIPGSGSSGAAVMSNSTGEYMDLQVDYWWTMPKSESSDQKDKKEKRDASSKFSLKTAFRSLLVSRMAPSMACIPSTSSSSVASGLAPPAFSMTVVTKEKKQKIMRIGKKAKELESKSQVIEGISRMVCTTKSQNVTLT
ncbi:hypothetical protein BaRGS_00038125, partial [Batillaria attramentaria]